MGIELLSSFFVCIYGDENWLTNEFVQNLCIASVGAEHKAVVNIQRAVIAYNLRWLQLI